MNFVGVTVRTLSIWSMIPLALLGGTPLGGCVCANGQYKFLCQRRNAETTDNSSIAVCSCCHPQGRHTESGSAGRSCCGRVSRSLASEGGLAVSTRCCRSVLALPNPSVIGEKPIVCDDEASLVWRAPVADQFCPSLALGVFQVGSQGDIPPPDFVILHRVFLI